LKGWLKGWLNGGMMWWRDRRVFGLGLHYDVYVSVYVNLYVNVYANADAVVDVDGWTLRVTLRVSSIDPHV